MDTIIYKVRRWEGEKFAVFTPVYALEMISEYREVLLRTKFTPAQFCELLGI